MPNFTANDTYSRVMFELFDEVEQISVSTAGQSFFGNPANGSNTDFVPDSEVGDIDIIRGNEKTAALIQREAGGFRNLSRQKNTDEQKYSSFARSFPLTEEEGDISSNQLKKRVAGEPLVSSFTQQQRAQILAARHHKEHIRRIIRLFERISWEVLLTGKQKAILGTTKNDLIYDYLRDANNSITVPAVWDTGTPDIMGDLDDGCDQMRKTGRITPDVAVFGGGAMSAAIKDTTFQTLADNRRFQLIEVSTNNPVPANLQRYVDAGLDARGFVITPKGRKLWTFTYNDGFDTDGGTFTEYMDTDKVILTSSKARFDRQFGPGEVLPMTPQRQQWFVENFGFSPMAAPMPMNIKNPTGLIVSQMFMFDGYGSANAKTLTIRTQAAPLFVTTQTDAVVVLDGLLT